MYRCAAENKFLEFMPPQVAAEIMRLCASRGVGASEVSEVRIRSVGKSSAVIRGERVPLLSRVCREDVKKCFLLLCDGALYAHRDNIREGFITLPHGIRVGICGQARYEGGVFVGVSDVASLVFRIPTHEASCADLIYGAWAEAKRGLLIYSSPGVGKTTALRTLVSMIGKGKDALQVIVVDERCEFIPEEYEFASVDILRGYRRKEGMEIALRVLSANVVCVDEIGSAEEALAILESLNSGIRFIATAHASSYSELARRVNIKALLEAQVFDVLVGLSLVDGLRVAEITRMDF